MELACPTCDTRTSVPEDRLPPEGARARCHSCSAVSVYYRGGLVADDPTPPRGIEPAHAMPEMPGQVDRLASIQTIALARPVVRETQAPPQPVVPGGPPRSIGWQIRTVEGDKGPLTIDALKPLIRDGRLGPDDLACPPGAETWERAGDLADLKRWFELQKKSGVAAKIAKPSDVASCVRHPGVRGRWMCQGCGDLSCDSCVITAELNRMTVKQCPACRRACTELVPTRKIVPFWQDMRDVLTFPVRGLGWIALILFPLMGIGYVMARFAAGISTMAWGAAGFLVLSIYAYHLLIIRETTQGARSMPNLGKIDDYKQDFLKPASKAAFVSILLFLPTGVATRSLEGAREQVDFAQASRKAIADEKAEAERRASDPNWKPDAPSEQDVQNAFESAFAKSGSDGSDAAGDATQKALSRLDQREDVDYDAELRDADAAIGAAKSRLFDLELLRAALAGCALFIWPIFLIVVAIFNTIMPVFQPQVLLRIIKEIPKEYGWCTATTSACFVLIYAFNLPFRGSMLFSNWLTSPVTYYLSLIAFYVMGRTAERAEQQIDWH
jgi:predicted Zn finger-like uncharacterized protein